MRELFPTQLYTMRSPNLPHPRSSPILILPWQPEHCAEIQTWWVLCIRPALLDEGISRAIELWMAAYFHYCLPHLHALLGQWVRWLIALALGNWGFQHFSPHLVRLM